VSELQLAFSQYGLFVWLLLLVLFIFLAVRQAGIQRRLNLLYHRYNTLSRGDDGVSLLDALDRHIAEVQDLKRSVAQLTNEYQLLNDGLRLSLRRVGIVRFNPFEDMGGDQSFSLALLDDNGDGIVISSLFGRAGSRIFAKPIKNGRSKYTLTDEEEQAIIQASLAR
jgi:hypothetical protein